MKFEKSDKAWIFDTGKGWVQVEIMRIVGNYYIVKMIGADIGFGVSSHRLLTEEEYKMQQDIKNIPHPPRPPMLH